MRHELDPRTCDGQWKRLQEEPLKREGELVDLADALVRHIEHELAELEEGEAAFVRECMRDLGY
jgi:hypothetical protein